MPVIQGPAVLASQESVGTVVNIQFIWEVMLYHIRVEGDTSV